MNTVPDIQHIQDGFIAQNSVGTTTNPGKSESLGVGFTLESLEATKGPKSPISQLISVETTEEIDGRVWQRKTLALG